MVKVYFNKLIDCPNTDIEVYKEINPIPFTISIGENLLFPTTIYCRNLTGENLIEFRFNKETNVLFEITLVAIENNSVEKQTILQDISYDSSLFYECKIIEEGSLLEGSASVEIFRTKDAIFYLLDKTEKKDLDHFQIGKDVFIGVDSNKFLKSVLIKNLTQENLMDIFGY